MYNDQWIQNKQNKKQKIYKTATSPCHSSGGYSPAFYSSGLGLIPGQVMCDL
jgi:hypothetical protein